MSLDPRETGRDGFALVHTLNHNLSFSIENGFSFMKVVLSFSKRLGRVMSYRDG